MTLRTLVSFSYSFLKALFAARFEEKGLNSIDSPFLGLRPIAKLHLLR
jgi:hypothetical protein